MNIILKKKLLRGSALAAAVLLLAGALWLMTGDDDQRLHQFVGKSMGTNWSVTVDKQFLSAYQLEQMRHIQKWTQDLLDQMEQVFSTWIPDSEISHMNRGEYHTNMSDMMRSALHQAHSLSFHNEDFLNFHLQGVLQHYGFELVDENNSGSDQQEWVGLNLSAFIKGHAVDAISDGLASMAYDNTLVELGGELVARCARRTEPWAIAIQHPHWPAQAVAVETLQICDQAVATSGDYHNTVSVDGQVLSHLIDPTTLKPKLNRTRSVTVVASSAGLADAYATAFAVSGLARSDDVFIHAPLRVLFLHENEAGEIESIWKDFSPDDYD